MQPGQQATSYPPCHLLVYSTIIYSYATLAYASMFYSIGGFIVVSTKNELLLQKAHWAELLRDLSSLLGGRFGSTELSRSGPFILPIQHTDALVSMEYDDIIRLEDDGVWKKPIRNGDDDGYGEGMQMAQWFSTDLATAENLHRWQQLGGIPTHTHTQKLTREYMHECAWYAYTLSVHNHHTHTHVYDAGDSYSMHSNVSVKIDILTYRHQIHHEGLQDTHHTHIHTKRDAIEIFKHIHTPPSPSPSIFTPFMPYTPHTLTIETSIHNPHNASVYVYVYESIPYTYTIDMNTYVFFQELGDGDRDGDGVWDPIHTLVNYTYTPPYTSTTQSMYGTITYPIYIPPYGVNTYRYDIHTHLMNIQQLPPDNSYGVLIPPVYVLFPDTQTHANTRIHTHTHTRWYISEPLLINTPTVDMSMPYTVFTLVSMYVLYFVCMCMCV